MFQVLSNKLKVKMDLNIKIIVESNYKVYTYTVTQLSTRLIEKFSVIDYKMPNMMVSTIS